MYKITMDTKTKKSLQEGRERILEELAKIKKPVVRQTLSEWISTPVKDKVQK